MNFLRLSLVFGFLLGSIGASTQETQQDAPGVYADRIVFGQSAAFSGPSQELGINMRLGIRAAFSEANKAGGVHGRSLDLITRDDQYEPDKAAANAQNLIADENVFALIGEVGTPTSKAVMPVIVRSRVPFIGPFTGATFLRENEALSWVINYRASYFQETEQMVEYLTKVRGISRIGIVYQDDSFGQVGYQGILNAMNRRDMTLVGTGIYPRNTIAVKTALLDLQLNNPEAIVVIGAYRPTAELIMWARYIGMDPVFITLSFVGSNALASHLADRGDGVLVTQVVPLPTSSDSDLNQRYQKALIAFDADAKPGFISFEGYIVGRLTIELLQRTGPRPTREGFMNTMRESKELLIDGLRLTYGDSDNQGSDNVFLTRIGSGQKYFNVSSN